MISFSIVQGADPITVRNQITMVKPYEEGGTDTYKQPGGQAQVNANYDVVEGLVSAFASTSDRRAWANASLEDDFEIIHTSNYRITFSFNYKGLVEVTGLDLFDAVSIRVDLKVYLININDGNILGQTTQTIYSSPNPLLSNVNYEPTGSANIVLTNSLLANQVYDWRAELLSDVSATDSMGNDLQVKADFFNLDYGAELTQVRVVDLSPDNTPPTTTSSLSGSEGENNWYTSNVMLQLTAVDAGYGVENTTYLINEGSTTRYIEPFTISLEGTNTIEYYSFDKANNKENPKTLDVNIDKTEPTGQVTINNYDEYSNSEEVMLYVVADDGEGSGLNQMRFRNEGDSWIDTWIDYTTEPIPWTLKTGDGNKRVYVQFKDNAGKISPETSDTIILDNEQPTTVPSLLGNEGEDNWYTSSVTVELTATDTGSGVNSTTYRINGAAWNSYTSPFTLGTEGTNIIEYYSSDNAGNTEIAETSNIKIDKTSPTGDVTINSGDIYTSSTSVSLSLTYADTVSGVDKVRYSNDAILDSQPWENPTASKPWTLSSGEGRKTVFYQIKDKAGNISPLEYDDIILDTDPPSAAIEINEGDEYTNSTSVVLFLQYSDNLGVSQVRYRNYGSSYTEWEQPSQTKEWILTTGDETKTVYAEFKDIAGSVSEIYDATINLVETESPSTPTPSPSAAPSEKGNVLIHVKDENNNPVSGATVTSITNPSGQSLLKGTTNAQGTVTFSNIIVGTYSFHASKGAFGSENAQANVLSQQTVTVNITLVEDLTEPTVSVTMTFENEGSSQRVFSVTAEDDLQGSGIATITLYIDDEPVKTWTTAGIHIYDEGSYSNGTHTYYVEAIDNAGNIIRNPVSGYLEFSVENIADVELEL